jgi:hypothetical protein
LSSEDTPVHESKYREYEGCLCPILEITIGEKKKKILGYADTGCSTGVFLFKEQTQGIEMGARISDEPSRCIAADGHILAGEEYVTTADIGGESRLIVVTVVDPARILGHVQPSEMIPLVGRSFLDTFDVLFKGKKKEIALFKC